MSYPDPDYAGWKDSVVQLLAYGWQRRPAIVTPVVASVEAVFARPSSAPKHWQLGKQRFRYPWPWTEGRNPAIGTMDLDNLWKAAMDAVVQAGILEDDRLVVGDGGSRKVFAATGETPCVEVRFWSAAEATASSPRR